MTRNVTNNDIHPEATPIPVLWALQITQCITCESSPNREIHVNFSPTYDSTPPIRYAASLVWELWALLDGIVIWNEESIAYISYDSYFFSALYCHECLYSSQQFSHSSTEECYDGPFNSSHATKCPVGTLGCIKKIQATSHGKNPYHVINATASGTSNKSSKDCTWAAVSNALLRAI